MSSGEMAVTGGVSAIAGAAGVASPAGGAVGPPAEQRQNAVADGKTVPPQAPTVEQVTEAIGSISDYVQTVSRDLSFQVDDSTGSTIVSVFDSQTEELIRQIPSDEVVSMARYLAEHAPDPLKGLLVDSKG